jgi:hypothetical protein
MLEASHHAWKSLYNAHKDNKRSYGFFERNAFYGKDKLMQIYGEKVATGRHAAPPGKAQNEDNSTASDNSDSSDSDTGFSTSSSRRHRKKRPRIVVELGEEVDKGEIDWSDSDHGNGTERASESDPFALDQESSEITSTSASQTPAKRADSEASSQPTLVPKSSKKKDTKKRKLSEVPADQQPQREEVKRERSSADKIKAGLDGLSKQAIQSNEIWQDALVARLKLIDYTVSSAIPVYK